MALGRMRRDWEDSCLMSLHSGGQGSRENVELQVRRGGSKVKEGVGVKCVGRKKKITNYPGFRPVFPPFRGT